MRSPRSRSVASRSPTARSPRWRRRSSGGDAAARLPMSRWCARCGACAPGRRCTGAHRLGKRVARALARRGDSALLDGVEPSCSCCALTCCVSAGCRPEAPRRDRRSRHAWRPRPPRRSSPLRCSPTWLSLRSTSSACGASSCSVPGRQVRRMIRPQPCSWFEIVIGKRRCVHRAGVARGGRLRRSRMAPDRGAGRDDAAGPAEGIQRARAQVPTLLAAPDDGASGRAARTGTGAGRRTPRGAAWAAQADDVVGILQVAEAEAAELELAAAALREMADSRIDFAALAQATNGVTAALFALPPGVEIDLPPDTIARFATTASERLLLAIGAPEAIEAIGRAVAEVNGRRARFPRLAAAERHRQPGAGRRQVEPRPRHRSRACASNWRLCPSGMGWPARWATLRSPPGVSSTVARSNRATSSRASPAGRPTARGSCGRSRPATRARLPPSRGRRAASARHSCCAIRGGHSRSRSSRGWSACRARAARTRACCWRSRCR